MWINCPEFCYRDNLTRFLKDLFLALLLQLSFFKLTFSYRKVVSCKGEKKVIIIITMLNNQGILNSVPTSNQHKSRRQVQYMLTGRVPTDQISSKCLISKFYFCFHVWMCCIYCTPAESPLIKTVSRVSKTFAGFPFAKVWCTFHNTLIRMLFYITGRRKYIVRRKYILF